MQKLYYELSGGRYEGWIYADGQRYILVSGSEAKIKAYARRNDLKPLFVSPNPLRS